MLSVAAALEALRAAGRPLNTRERRLVVPRGKTPIATMSAALYQHAHDGEVLKLDAPGSGRAKRGSVRWTVRGS